MLGYGEMTSSWKIPASSILFAFLLLALFAVGSSSAQTEKVVRLLGFVVRYHAAGIRRLGCGIVHRTRTQSQFCRWQSRFGVALCPGHAERLPVFGRAPQGYFPRDLCDVALLHGPRERHSGAFRKH